MENHYQTTYRHIKDEMNFTNVLLYFEMLKLKFQEKEFSSTDTLEQIISALGIDYLIEDDFIQSKTLKKNVTINSCDKIFNKIIEAIDKMNKIIRDKIRVSTEKGIDG